MHGIHIIVCTDFLEVWNPLGISYVPQAFKSQVIWGYEFLHKKLAPNVLILCGLPAMLPTVVAVEAVTATPCSLRGLSRASSVTTTSQSAYSGADPRTDWEGERRGQDGRTPLLVVSVEDCGSTRHGQDVTVVLREEWAGRNRGRPRELSTSGRVFRGHG